MQAQARNDAPHSQSHPAMVLELFLHARQPTLAYPLVKGAASGGFATLNSGVPGVAMRLLGLNVKRVAEMGIKHRVALGSQWQGVPLAGGLMSYAPDLIDNFASAAVYVDRIFRGAKPADLPVDSPARIKLIINRKAADALGLTVPRSVLLRADQVIG